MICVFIILKIILLFIIYEIKVQVPTTNITHNIPMKRPFCDISIRAVTDCCHNLKNGF